MAETNPTTSAATTTALPAWHPAWAKQLEQLYFSGTTSMFVLHGNVYDLIRCEDADDNPYCGIHDFLAEQIFGTWDLVIGFDMAQGLRVLAGDDAKRHQQMVTTLAARFGEAGNWPRDPEIALLGLDKYLERNLIEDGDKQKSMCMVFDYAQYLAPAGDLASLARASANLVRLLRWAQNPYIKRANVAFCLIAEKLTEINDRLLHSPHIATIEVPLPDQEQRTKFAEYALDGFVAKESKSSSSRVNVVANVQTPDQRERSAGATRLTEDSKSLSASDVAKLSNGLTLVSINVLLSQGEKGATGLDPMRLRQMKKSLIERQCQGLLEFIEPSHTLDLVVGQQAAKDRLKQDADLLLKGHLDAAPMGYIFCGAVGTGKTFLAECYAGSVGIPCVKLRNFRSKYVGETEGNLEQVLNVLRSLGPVVVIIDEADAALGDRDAGGDSGTSGRVFSMIASQMGDTQYRGKIVWMLLTCRPDLLPIDLKRQGRAEVHIPMFYPQDETELTAMFRTLAKKNKVTLKPEDIPTVSPDRGLSGSDIESVVVTAKRNALVAGRADLTKADLEAALTDFIPSAQGLEKEMQELAAVLECTSTAFLPKSWREKVARPERRSQLQQRMVAIKQLLEDK